jgi:hypothetical protein
VQAVVAQPVCATQSFKTTQVQDVEAKALFGATNDETIGSAITAISPAFLIISLLDFPNSDTEISF